MSYARSPLTEQVSLPSSSQAAVSVGISFKPLSTQRGLAVAGLIASFWRMKLQTTVSLLFSTSAEVKLKYSFARRRPVLSIVTPSGAVSVMVTVVSGLIRSASWSRKSHAVRPS